MQVPAIAAHFSVLLLFGVVIPWLKGIDLLQLLLLLPYSMLGVFYVSPQAVEAGAGNPISLYALGRAVLTGWALGAIVLVLGILTLSLQEGRKVVPPGSIFLCLLVLSLLACLLSGAISVRVALAARTPGTARRRMRLGLLVVLCILLAVPRLLDEEQTGELLAALSPEGLIRITMALVPLTAVTSLVLLRSKRARYTG